MTDYSEAAENIWAYANGRWFHDGSAGVPYVRADLYASLSAANKALTAERDDWRSRYNKALVDIDAAAFRADRLSAELAEARGILTLIAHTFTEGSHGNTKCLPGGDYQEMARSFLASKEASR